MARLRVLKDGVELQNLDLNAAGKSSVVLGRAEGADIRLDDRAIGREHAIFLISSGGVAVQKKSKFGKMSVNGAETSESPVKPGDVINIADYQVRVEEGPAASAAPEAGAPSPIANEVTPPQGTQAPPLDASEAPAISSNEATPPQGTQAPSLDAPVAIEAGGADGMVAMEQPAASDLSQAGGVPIEGAPVAEQPTGGVAESPPVEEGGERTAMISTSHVDMRLEFKPGDANVTDFAIKKNEISIGRGSTCDVVITDKKSSRKHLIIKRVGMNFVAQDLGSANGTYINGNKFSEQELSGDDVLRIGETEFTFKAISQEYLQQEQAQEFIAPPPEEMPPEAAPEGALIDPSAGGLGAPGISGIGADAGMGGIPGVGAAPGGAAPEGPPPKDLVGKFKVWWKKQPPKKQKMYMAGAVLLSLVMFAGDDEDPKKKKKPSPKGPSGVAMNASGAADMTSEAAFKSLPPEKQQFIVNEYQLASDLYKKQDFENALYAIKRIHGEIPQGYKDSKAYETYAKKAIDIEKQTRDEEERKKHEAEMRKQLEELVVQAQAAFDAGKDAEAKDFFAKVLEHDPDNPTVLRLRQAMDERDNQKRAKEEAEKEREFQRKQHEMAVKAGRDLLDQGRYYEVMDKMDDAMVLLGNEPDLLKEARDIVQKAKDLLRSKTQPHIEAGKVAFDAGDFQKAREEYLKAIAVDSKAKAAYEGISKIREVVHERSRKIYIEAAVAEGVSDYKTAREKYKECLDSAVKEDSYYGMCTRKFKRFELVGHLQASAAAGGVSADPAEPRAPAAAPSPPPDEPPPPETPADPGAAPKPDTTTAAPPAAPAAPEASAPAAPAPPMPTSGGGGGW